MALDSLREVLSRNNRQIRREFALIEPSEHQLRSDLFLNAANKLWGAFEIKRHDDSPAQQTAKKRRDPLRGVTAAEQYAISFVHPARFQFA